MKRLSLYFVQGLLILLPITGTFFILAFVYSKIAGFGSAILSPVWGTELMPGIDFIFAIALVCLVGLVGNWWISKKMLGLVEDFIFRMPGVKNIYNTIKEAFKSLAGEEKKFDTVVLVKLNEKVSRLGFLTIKESPFANGSGKDLVGVYFPQTLQVAGDLYWVPRESVTIVNMTVDRALRLIISGGATGAETVVD